MIIDWQVRDIVNEINKISRAANDPYMDGFNTWGAKQDLYQILWHVESQLKKCSTYAGEDDYVKEHEKRLTFEALGGKNGLRMRKITNR